MDHATIKTCPLNIALAVSSGERPPGFHQEKESE
jgi:hypothetical protein